MKIILLIPAYKPGPELVDYVRQLSGKGFVGTIVVNDGSPAEFQSTFHALQEIPGVVVLNHAINLGKGMALKTGLNHALVKFEDAMGVVTADADGQHQIADVIKTAHTLEKFSKSLVIGVRQFDHRVPLRSRIGNLLTKFLFRILIGGKITDTQSGLRGIPRDMIPQLLRIQTNGYEFELDMLLLCKHTHRSVAERPIKTIYIEGNRSSHFNPLLDSMKIYFVLFRSVIVSLITVTIDTIIFIPMYHHTQHLLFSQLTGRFIGMIFQYSAAKNAVFYSDKKHRETLPWFVFLVTMFGFVSYGLIRLLTFKFSIGVTLAKIIAEGLIYLAGFSILRDFVFTQRKE